MLGLKRFKLWKFETIILSERGRSSGVERNLAKVEAVGSNPIARSILSGPLLDFPAALLGPPVTRMT